MQVNFATTVQDNLEGILSTINNSSTLIDFSISHGELISRVTKIDRNDKVIAIPGKGGYDYRNTAVLTNQISHNEVNNPPKPKMVAKTAEMKRLNTAVAHELTYETWHSPFLEDISRTELQKACVLGTERAMLYGIGQTQGIMGRVPFDKKNWTHGGPAPKGSAGWFQGQGLYEHLYRYSEAGYDIKDATFLMGSKAFHQILFYGVSGGNRMGLVKIKDDGSCSILGMPCAECKALKPKEILFGNLKLMVMSLLDMSIESIIDGRTGHKIISCNSSFYFGVIDTAGFFTWEVADTNHDKQPT